MLYNGRMDTFIFDLYNTLVSIRTDEQRSSTWLPVAEFFRERGLNADPDKLRVWYDEFWYKQLDERKAEGKFAYPEGDVVEVFRAMAKNLGGEWSYETGEDAAKLMRRSSMVYIKLFDGTLELLASLRALGAKLYLLTNAQAAITYDEIEECGLMNKFDGMLISSEWGCRKPDPKYFEILFDKFGLKKADSVMVGDDKESDGKGAKAFGIKYVCAEGGAAAVSDKLIKLAKSR